MAANKEPLTHVLVPRHTKISDKEKEELFARYSITTRELPKIFKSDPAIAHIAGLKENDVVKIERRSPTAGTSVFYRGVINE